eukprot:1157166-Pelagomonas_calceolata.AAC.4
MFVPQTCGVAVGAPFCLEVAEESDVELLRVSIKPAKLRESGAQWRAHARVMVSGTKHVEVSRSLPGCIAKLPHSVQGLRLVALWLRI